MNEGESRKGIVGALTLVVIAAAGRARSAADWR